MANSKDEFPCAGGCGKTIIGPGRCLDCALAAELYRDDGRAQAQRTASLLCPPAPGAVRHDDEKPRYDLLPPEFLDALARHMTAGAKKYPQNGGRNWELGMRHGRVFASLMRHAWAWMRGEDVDEETGSHHMVCAAWNAMVLAVYAARGVGEDDRPVKK